MKTNSIFVALFVVLSQTNLFGQGIPLQDSGLRSNSGSRQSQSIGGGVFGLGPATSQVVPRGKINVGASSRTNLQRPNVPIKKPQTANNGKLTIEVAYTVKQWNPRFYNQSVRQSQAQIFQLDNAVNRYNAIYRQNPTEINRQRLIGTLNQLRDAKNQLAKNKANWNTPLNVQFDGNSIHHKQRLVERALQLGMAGKSLQFRTNRDGSAKVILFHGRPGYSKSEDVSRLF